MDRSEKLPPFLYLLADHLDAMLAAGEDLVSAGADWEAGDALDPGVAGQRRFVLSRVRAHEDKLLVRLAKARENVAQLARDDARFKHIAHLFRATTADLVSEGGRRSVRGEVDDFDHANDAIAYLRSRGLIDPEAAGLPADETLAFGDTFLVSGLVPLGVVMDLVAEFLDALEIHYELYPDADEGEAGAQAA